MSKKAKSVPVDSKCIDDLEAFDKPEVTTAIAELDKEALSSLNYESVLSRVLEAKQALNKLFIDKKKAVDLILSCMIARVPMVLLGKPGTAKSALIRAFCSTMGLGAKHENIREFDERLWDTLQRAKSKGPDEATREGSERQKADEHRLKVVDRPLFEYLVTRYTTPEEILGPTSIEAMLTLSLFYRDSAGMLPGAEVVFLDEIFKANSAILNALLSIINERIYYNAGRAFDVDLVTVFGASNEAPDSEELAALYDRFPIRVVSDPVPDESIEELLDSSEKMARDLDIKLASNDGASIEKVTCVNDFRLLSRISHLKYGQDGRIFCEKSLGSRAQQSFRVNFIHLFRTLRQEFGISDRTPVRLLQVAKAQAMLNKATELTSEYLEVFRYCAPDVETARVLAEIVTETVDSLED